MQCEPPQQGRTPPARPGVAFPTKPIPDKPCSQLAWFLTPLLLGSSSQCSGQSGPSSACSIACSPPAPGHSCAELRQFSALLVSDAEKLAPTAGFVAEITGDSTSLCGSPPLHSLQGHSYLGKLLQKHNLTQTPRGRRRRQRAEHLAGTPPGHGPEAALIKHHCANRSFSAGSFPAEKPTRGSPPAPRGRDSAHHGELMTATQSLRAVVKYLLSLQVTLKPIN